ncbi:MAG: hypothetical protein WAS27_00195 [Candidatus Saccharimonadales bacterium]
MADISASSDAVEWSADSDPVSLTAGGYEYTHADGHVQRAETAETARAMCPILGKMAIEQVGLLLEVAALGQQKMKEEEAQQPTEDDLEAEESQTPHKQVVEQVTTQPTEDIQDPKTTPRYTAYQEAVEDMIVPDTHSTRELLAADSDEKQPDSEPVIALPLVDNAAPTNSALFERPTVVADESVVHDVRGDDSFRAPNQATVGMDTVTLELPELEPDDVGSEPCQIDAPEVVVEYVTDSLEEMVEEMPETNTEALIQEERELVPRVDKREEDPIETFDDVATTLRQFLLPAEDTPETPPLAATIEATPLAVMDVRDDNELQGEMAPIITVVTERLTQLTMEYQTGVIRPMEDVIESVEVINTLNAQDAAPEALEEAQDALRERSVALFETLEIDYDEDDIELFTVALLLQSDAELLQPVEESLEEIEVDLENDGTHEGNYTFSQVVSMAADDDECDIQHFLGKFVLVHVNR